MFGGIPIFPGGMAHSGGPMHASQQAQGPNYEAMMQQFINGVWGVGGMFGPEPQQEQRSGPPPTAAATLRALPRIKVTPYDIAANEGLTDCSICLDELVHGEPALRIPCGHIFHEDCVKAWLQRSNECPVCRFELPTDDEEYERGRKSRTANRKIRMRTSDLDVKSVQELQRLAHFLAIDVRGCLEKREIVERIAASSKVQIVQADAASDAGLLMAGGSAPVPGAPTLVQSQLDNMSIGDVRALLARLGVDSTGCQDKADMVSRLGLSGRGIIVDDTQHDQARGSNSQPSKDFASTASGTERPQTVDSPQNEDSSALPLAGRSLAELRQLAKQHKVSLDGCLEKTDVVQRLQAVVNIQ